MKVLRSEIYYIEDELLDKRSNLIEPIMYKVSKSDFYKIENQLQEHNIKYEIVKIYGYQNSDDICLYARGENSRMGPRNHGPFLTSDFI